MSKNDFPVNRYETPTGLGSRFKLDDGLDVILERTEFGRFTKVLWPTVLRPRAFFDLATEAIEEVYVSVKDHTTKHTIGKDELIAVEDDITIASVRLPDISSMLVWQRDVNPKRFQGGIISGRIGSVAVSPLMEATGSASMVGNVEAIVGQIESELGLNTPRQA